MTTPALESNSTMGEVLAYRRPNDPTISAAASPKALSLSAMYQPAASDPAAVEELMTMMGQALDIFAHKAPSNVSTLMPIYMKILGDLPIDLARRALWGAIETCKFWPLPADLLEPVREEAEMRREAPGGERFLKWKCKRLADARVDSNDKRLVVWKINTVEAVEALVAAHAAGPAAYAAELNRLCPQPPAPPTTPPANEKHRRGAAEIIARHKRNMTGMDDDKQADAAWTNLSNVERGEYWRAQMDLPSKYATGRSARP